MNNILFIRSARSFVSKSYVRNLYLGLADDSTTLKKLDNEEFKKCDTLPGTQIKEKYKIMLPVMENSNEDEILDSNNSQKTKNSLKEKNYKDCLFYDI